MPKYPRRPCRMTGCPNLADPGEQYCLEHKKKSELANGAIYADTGETIAFHDRKLDALEDIIEAANGKPLLVAYWFKHDLQRIKERFDVRELRSRQDMLDWNHQCYKGCGKPGAPDSS